MTWRADSRRADRLGALKEQVFLALLAVGRSNGAIAER